MKIAWIIQCHKNAEQVNMLTDVLRRDGDDVYIHCDVKSGDLRRELTTGDGIFVLDEGKCVSVRWGDFSQCRATLSLLEGIRSGGKTYDYVCFLSGQCLPIQPIFALKEKLSKERGEYIDVIGKDTAYRAGFAKRNDVPYSAAMRNNTVKGKILRKIWRIASGGSVRTFGIFKKTTDVDTYFGSSWWMLSYECVLAMLYYLDKHLYLTDYFATSLCPDESFFQTLFMATPFAGRQKGLIWYIDWTGGNNSPKVLRSDDYDALRQSGKYFARKFDICTDRKIVERVIGDFVGSDQRR